MTDEVPYKAGLPIGHKLAKARKLRGWTQEQFAKKLGTSKSGVSRIENSFEIEPEVLEKVCKVLDVTVEGLHSLDEDSTIYLTANYYENCNVQHSNTGNSPYSTFHFNSLGDVIKYFEKELSRVRREFQAELKKTKTK